MTYFANYLLPAFIHAVTGEFTSEFGAEQYQREVGRVIEQASKKFFGRGGSNLIAQKTKEWVQDTKEYIDTFDNNYFDDATDIPKSFIDNLKRNPSSGTGKALISFHRALIIHYRLHMYIDPEDRKFADDLDGKVFSGRTFKQALRKSVFSFEPDAYYQPARMAAPMHHPDYITAKQAKEALEANSDDAIWLSPHNHSTIRLEGREDELNRLTEFAEHRAPFRVLPVIAPSGAGKTRLISEWMKPYSAKTNPATKWEAGFLVSERNDHARDPEPWRKWEIKKNTLIVIDYTYAFDEVVKTIAERAINRAGGESPTIRVRLIVVDHIMPQALQDDFFWRQFSGGRRATMDSFRASYLEKPLVLKSEGHNSNMLRQIVTASARVGGRSISENDRDVSNALEHLDRMGRQQGDRDSARHPLFAALLGQMLRDPEHRPDFSTWSRRDLVDQYFDSRDRLPWGDAHWRSDEQVTQREVEGLYAGALVAAATLRRGINRHTAEPHLPHQNEAIFQIAQRVTSSTKYHFIEPFLPDILGETFLLKFLEAVGGDSDVFASFLALLSSSGEDSQEQARNFGETIARLARNLANDNPELRDVSESWTRLPGLLRPENFAHNTTLRAYAAYVTADVVDQLARITHNAKNNGNDKGIAESFLPIIYKLIRQVKLEFYCTPPSSEELFYRLNSLFCFYEFCDSEYESVIQGIIIKSSFYFHDTGEDKLNVGLFAAYSGRPRSLQLLVNIMGKKIVFASQDGLTPFLLACAGGHLAVAEFVHAQDYTLISAATEDGRTALMLACEGGHLAVVEFLHTQDPSLICAKTADGKTAMMLACESGHLAVVELLHTQDPSLICAKTADSKTAMMLACESGHLAVVEFLHTQDPSLISATTDDGETVLMLACNDGHLAVVDFLHTQDPSLISATATRSMVNGWTALMFACYRNHISIVEFLLTEAPNLISVPATGGWRDGWTPVMLACEGGHLAIVEYLHTQDPAVISATIPKGAWNAGGTALLAACERGQLEVAKFLHAHDPTLISATTEDGRTALMAACHGGHLAVAEFLHVEEPSLIYAKMANGYTALTATFASGQLPIAEFLVAQNPTLVYATLSDGSTPLMAACLGGHLAIAEFLLVQDPTLASAITENGTTALMLACSSGEVALAKLIYAQCPSLVSAATLEGRTALFAACSTGELALVEFLHSQDPGLISATRFDGWNAMFSACDSGHLSVAEFLHAQDPTLVCAVAKNGLTPLMAACLSGELTVVDFIYSLAPYLISAPRKDGLTPLMAACGRGHLAVAQFLHAQDPTLIFATKEDGWTALMEACQWWQQAVVAFLLAQDSSLVSKTANDGRTALMVACSANSPAIVRLLLEMGADKNAATNTGTTSMSIAQSIGSDKIIYLLDKWPGDHEHSAPLQAIKAHEGQ